MFQDLLGQEIKEGDFIAYGANVSGIAVLYTYQVASVLEDSIRAFQVNVEQEHETKKLTGFMRGWQGKGFTPSSKVKLSKGFNMVVVTDRFKDLPDLTPQGGLQ